MRLSQPVERSQQFPNSISYPLLANEALHSTSDLRMARAAPALLFDSLASELERYLAIHPHLNESSTLWLPLRHTVRIIARTDAY